MDQFDTDDDENVNNIIEISDGLEIEDYGAKMRTPHDKRGCRGAFHKSSLTKLCYKKEDLEIFPTFQFRNLPFCILNLSFRKY